jgi:hypothetical protein
VLPLQSLFVAESCLTLQSYVSGDAKFASSKKVVSEFAIACTAASLPFALLSGALGLSLAHSLLQHHLFSFCCLGMFGEIA